MHMMPLNLGARAFVVTACWWRARCKSLRDIGAPPQHAITPIEVFAQCTHLLGTTLFYYAYVIALCICIHLYAYSNIICDEGVGKTVKSEYDCCFHYLRSKAQHC